MVCFISTRIQGRPQMKNKMHLMIFYADGRSGHVPLDIFRSLKVVMVLVVALFIFSTGITFYNYYRLSGLKNNYTQTLHSLSLEKPAVQQQITKLKDFEEKISFFLSGAITDYSRMGKTALGQPSDLGMGGGEEGLVVVEEIIPRQELEEPEIASIPLNLYESEDAGIHLAQLKKRLEDLAVLAVKKKNRLDYTPSVRPAQGYISSKFGWRRSPFTGRRHYHRGIDIVNKIGTPVKATASGRVYFVGTKIFWGNSIFIEHIDGMLSKFGHLSMFEVDNGDSVRRGDIIGYMGMSGRSTGPHLHYQIEIGDQALDPMRFILEDYN